MKHTPHGNPGKELSVQIEEALDGITQPLERLKAALRTIRKVKNEWKERVRESPPARLEEAVHLYKSVWPAIISWHIYHVEKYAMEAGAPLSDATKQRKHWKRELVFLTHFFNTHAFHYQYYKLGATELDHLYFTPNTELPDILIPEVPEVNSATGTKMGYLFAKFMAYERLQAELVEALHAPEGATESRKTRGGKEMRWTGESSNLIELAYGIYETKQINKGGVDIGDIIGWLEDSFRISLHRYYRRFSEIKRRKTISRTRFLDEMRDAVNKRIDDGDAYHPPGDPRHGRF